MGRKPDQTSKKKKPPFNTDSRREITATFENDLYRRNQSNATVTTYGACLDVFSHFYLHRLDKPGPYVGFLDQG